MGHSCSSVSSDAVQVDVFPTEARMKAKAKKAELGYDDCGGDHSAIMYIDEINHNACDCVCFSGYKQETDPDLMFELNFDCFMLNFEADLYPKLCPFLQGGYFPFQPLQLLVVKLFPSEVHVRQSLLMIVKTVPPGTAWGHNHLAQICSQWFELC